MKEYNLTEAEVEALTRIQSELQDNENNKHRLQGALQASILLIAQQQNMGFENLRYLPEVSKLTSDKQEE
jgi:hypothetical protein